MDRSNSCRPFRKVGSIRKRFEKRTENQQFQNIRRTLSYIPICSDIVKNRKLHYEEQLLDQNRARGYSKSNHFNSYSNDNPRIPADSSFENSTSQFNSLFIPDGNSHNISVNKQANQDLVGNNESNTNSCYEVSLSNSEEFMTDTNFASPKLKFEPFHEVKTNTFNTAPIIRSVIPKKVIDSKSATAYSSNAHVYRNEESRNINVPAGDCNQRNYYENSNNILSNFYSPSKPLGRLSHHNSIDMEPAETPYTNNNAHYVNNEDISIHSSYSQPFNNGDAIFHSQNSKTGSSSSTSSNSKLPPKPLAKSSQNSTVINIEQPSQAFHPDSNTHCIYKAVHANASINRNDNNQKLNNDRNNTANALPRNRSSSHNATVILEPDQLSFPGTSTDHIYNDKFKDSSLHISYNPINRDGFSFSGLNTDYVQEYECNQQTGNEEENVTSFNSRSTDELVKELKSNIPKTRPKSDVPLYIKISDDEIEYSVSNGVTENTNFFPSKTDSEIESSKSIRNMMFNTLPRDRSSIPSVYHPNFKKTNECEVKSESQQASPTHTNNDENIYYTIDNHLSTKNENHLEHDILDFAREYVETFDSEDDVFGAHVIIETDFCYETFNNGNENVLFKIWIDRDLVTNDSEDEAMSRNDDVYYKNTIDEVTNESDPEVNNAGCTSPASNVGTEGKLDNRNEDQNQQYDIIDEITKKPEAEVKDADNTSNVSKVGTAKNFEEDLEFQNEDSTDGSSLWRNSNYFNTSVDLALSFTCKYTELKDRSNRKQIVSADSTHGMLIRTKKEKMSSRKEQLEWNPLKIMQQYNVIRELIDTEQTYVKNMLYIIVNYLHVFRRDPYISPDIELVFGNIEQIYKETKRILSIVKECTSVEEIARVFLTSVHVFELYIEYMRNKSKSHQYSTKAFSKLLKSRQKELNDHHTCEDYLVNPVQRLARYGLLLRKLSETLNKSKQTCKALDEAIALIERKTFEGNTIMAIDSIRYCPMNLKRLKRYLMKDTFCINRKYNNSLFLFEGGVVFCKESQDNIDQYEFLECIEMHELSLKHSSNSSSFQLGYYNKSKKYVDENKYEFDIEARSMTIKEDWVNEIQRLLWRQLQYFKDLQNATRNRKDISQEEINYEGTPMAEENEYRVMEGALYNDCNNKTYTYFDKDKNTRIEITTHSEELETNNSYECAPSSEEKEFDLDDNIQAEDTSSIKYVNSKTRIMHQIPESKNFLMYNISEGQSNAIKQLLTDEENYLNEMQEIMINNWIDSEDPNFCPYIQILMENINGIYQKGYKMYSELLKCDTIDAFAKIFWDNTPLFDLYIKFIYNKLTFCRYTIHKKLELEKHHTFDEYLMNGVVRLRRYKSHLDLLDKELKNSDELCAILKDVIALLNEKMSTLKRILTINSIQRCPVNLENMGSFIMMEMFRIKGNGETMVFLFDRIIILTVEEGIHKDTYIYVDSIEMANLSVSSSGTKSLRLRTKENKPESAKKKYELEAISDEKRQIWKNRLDKLLKSL